MARIASSSRTYTETFKAVCDASSQMGEKNDCSVKALVVVTGLSYAECHEALKLAGRKNGQGVFPKQIASALNHLGFYLERVDTSDIIAQYPGVHKGLQSITTHHPERFPKAFEGIQKALMYTSGHVSALVDGTVHDWAKGRSKRVVSMYLVWRVQK